MRFCEFFFLTAGLQQITNNRELHYTMDFEKGKSVALNFSAPLKYGAANLYHSNRQHGLFFSKECSLQSDLLWYSMNFCQRNPYIMSFNSFPNDKF